MRLAPGAEVAKDLHGTLTYKIAREDLTRCKMREQLERYCGQDTEGIICIVDALRKLA